VGGGGERRTLPLAGRLADGWNVPMATVEDFRRKAAIVARPPRPPDGTRRRWSAR
jgi:alkanesulfonate monooxygenase SsuD/methylene tetrahydromethanopterin reductase-like flavin-dependent oxidoreductase (luciferase family)